MPADVPDQTGLSLAYLHGFGNEHASEALPGALPRGQNAPQRHPMGLYAEQINNSSFTAPRAENRRGWVYRIYPSAAAQTRYRRIDSPIAPRFTADPVATPNRHRWTPWQAPSAPRDFLDGLTPIAACGSPDANAGITLYAFAFSASMEGRVFASFDGEFVIVPQTGRLLITTELGRLDLAPGEFACIPRGIRFKVDLLSGPSTGYICENHGPHFRLPELGPIGSNGLANPRDFQVPVAAYVNDDRPVDFVAKLGGEIFTSTLRRTPFDVVAWFGTFAPYKYDIRLFNAMNSVTYDHPDPSIFSALTSPSGLPGTANCDFAVFPPRWLVADATFRPPYYHRNVMSEFLMSVLGNPEARGKDYRVGSAHLHNCFAGHGPDPDVYERASTAELKPMREETMMVMFETRLPFRITDQALGAANYDAGYEDNWARLPAAFKL